MAKQTRRAHDQVPALVRMTWTEEAMSPHKAILTRSKTDYSLSVQPETTSAPIQPPKRWSRVVLSIFYGLLIAPSLMLTYGAIFAFDSPGSEKSRLTTLFALSTAIVPLTLLLSCIGGLICTIGIQNSGKIIVGRMFGSLPIVNLALILLSIALLQVFCGGRLVCDL